MNRVFDAIADKHSTSSSVSLTPLHYQQLVHLLKSQLMPHFDNSKLDNSAGKIFTSCHRNTNLKNDSWIIDSGATSHITHSSHFFLDSKPLTNHFVSLPNHTNILAHAIGNVNVITRYRNT